MLVFATTAAAQEACLSATAPPISAPAAALRFGITPQAAGSAGSAQDEVAPEDPGEALAALKRLRPPARPLVVRLNRLLMSDGRAGIEHFAALARRYRRAGFEVESQVRYHPAPAGEGDIAAWRRFVRRAARTLGRNDALVALTITNEVNLPVSANTSDGAYEGALEAIVRGTTMARHELDRIGRTDVELGFSYAYRWLPHADAEFWRQIGDRSTAKFRRAVDYVGVQLYPGLFFPPVLAPGETAGEATIEALALVRRCYMPLARLGHRVALWVTENGYATNLGRTEPGQAADLSSTVADLHRFSATLNATDYRYFNLRDNRPAGPNLFDDVGLLRSDYSPKPAFGVYRSLMRRFGTPRGGR